MNELLSLLINTLKANQNPSHPFEVYPSFDSLPVSSKSRDFFIVISPEKFQLNPPYPGTSGKISPFTADFRIYVLASMSTPNQKLWEFFYSMIVPALHSANCFLDEMLTDAPQIDLKLQKAVYSGTFRLKGLYVPEQEVS